MTKKELIIEYCKLAIVVAIVLLSSCLEAIYAAVREAIQ